MNSTALRRVLAPGIGLVLLALIAGTLGYISDGSDEALSLTAPEMTTNTVVRGAVQQVSGDQLTITTRDGVQAVRLTPETIYESLGTTTTLHLDLDDDWLNVGAIPHQQTLSVINGLVVISRNGPP
jgi:hypothetical protein